MKLKRSLCLILCLALLALPLPACSENSSYDSHDLLGNGWQVERSLELLYSEHFSVDYFEGGYALISISDGSRFLVVPENSGVPSGIHSDIVVLQQPIENIYLVATSAMCLFDALGTLDTIRLSGTKASDWHIENARRALEDGRILFAGKYSAPDYELILAENCNLSIQSTMISHKPEIKDKLNELGIPVLVDQSSYESHPLGRTEWIKLYAVLSGTEELAQAIFDKQVAFLEEASQGDSTEKEVAFFYISSSGKVVARKSGDYVTSMIVLAGGTYVFENSSDTGGATSTTNLEMEAFYTTAKDADVIIYNSTVSGELTSLEELIGLNGLLADFKAVQTGNVWCTEKDLFQDTTQLGLMISNIREILTSDDAELTELDFFFRLQ